MRQLRQSLNILNKLTKQYRLILHHKNVQFFKCSVNIDMFIVLLFPLGWEADG